MNLVYSINTLLIQDKHHAYISNVGSVGSVKLSQE